MTRPITQYGTQHLTRCITGDECQIADAADR